MTWIRQVGRIEFSLSHKLLHETCEMGPGKHQQYLPQGSRIVIPAVTIIETFPISLAITPCHPISPALWCKREYLVCTWERMSLRFLITLKVIPRGWRAQRNGGEPWWPTLSWLLRRGPLLDTRESVSDKVKDCLCCLMHNWCMKYSKGRISWPLVWLHCIWKCLFLRFWYMFPVQNLYSQDTGFFCNIYTRSHLSL